MKRYGPRDYVQLTSALLLLQGAAAYDYVDREGRKHTIKKTLIELNPPDYHWNIRDDTLKFNLRPQNDGDYLSSMQAQYNEEFIDNFRIEYTNVDTEESAWSAWVGNYGEDGVVGEEREDDPTYVVTQNIEHCWDNVWMGVMETDNGTNLVVRIMFFNYMSRIGQALGTNENGALATELSVHYQFCTEDDAETGRECCITGAFGTYNDQDAPDYPGALGSIGFYYDEVEPSCDESAWYVDGWAPSGELEVEEAGQYSAGVCCGDGEGDCGPSDTVEFTSTAEFEVTSNGLEDYTADEEASSTWGVGDPLTVPTAFMAELEEELALSYQSYKNGWSTTTNTESDGVYHSENARDLSSDQQTAVSSGTTDASSTTISTSLSCHTPSGGLDGESWYALEFDQVKYSQPVTLYLSNGCANTAQVQARVSVTALDPEGACDVQLCATGDCSPSDGCDEVATPDMETATALTSLIGEANLDIDEPATMKVGTAVAIAALSLGALVAIGCLIRKGRKGHEEPYRAPLAAETNTA